MEYEISCGADPHGFDSWDAIRSHHPPPKAIHQILLHQNMKNSQDPSFTAVNLIVLIPLLPNTIIQIISKHESSLGGIKCLTQLGGKISATRLSF